MKKSVSLITAIVGTALVSCSTVQTISFDQLEAADINFPVSVKNVAVVNNMPVFEAGKSHKEISTRLEGDGKTASETLAKAIADANYFDQVIICDSALRGNDTEPRENVLLTKEEVQQLTTDLGADLVFSFDQVHIQTQPGVMFFSDFPYPIDAINAIVTPVIRIYVPNRQTPLLVVSKQDTISWEMGHTLSDELIVKEASEYAAYMPINHLLPHWKEVTRFYYDGGNVEMRDAGVCVREGNWDDAYRLWSNVYEKKKGRQQMKAALNIALYHEMKDDITKAREWAEKAQQLAKPGSVDEYQINFYVVALMEREGKLSRLNVQMNRFDDNF
ncbi:DUF6340 family protein [Phocaeicola sp.]